MIPSSGCNPRTDVVLVQCCCVGATGARLMITVAQAWKHWPKATLVPTKLSQTQRRGSSGWTEQGLGKAGLSEGVGRWAYQPGEEGAFNCSL